MHGLTSSEPLFFYFRETLSSRNGWICGKEDYISLTYSVGQAGGIVGVILFSYLSDKYGRKTIFWVTTAVIIICTEIKTFFPENHIIFYGCKFIAQAGYMSTYQLPFSVMTEVSDADYRTWAVGLTWVIWVIGICALPLFAYLLSHWFWISLVLVWPLATLFFCYKLLPESPRYYLTVEGKVDEAAKVISDIARVNSKPEPNDLHARLTKINKAILAEPRFGYLSLFHSWGMTRKITFLSFAWTANSYTYSQLFLNISNMHGSMFLNFFLLSVVEAPACFLAMAIMVRQCIQNVWLSISM